MWLNCVKLSRHLFAAFWFDYCIWDILKGVNICLWIEFSSVWYAVRLFLRKKKLIKIKGLNATYQIYFVLKYIDFDVLQNFTKKIVYIDKLLVMYGNRWNTFSVSQYCIFNEQRPRFSSQENPLHWTVNAIQITSLECLEHTPNAYDVPLTRRLWTDSSPEYLQPSFFLNFLRLISKRFTLSRLLDCVSKFNCFTWLIHCHFRSSSHRSPSRARNRFIVCCSSSIA